MLFLKTTPQHNGRCFHRETHSCFDGLPGGSYSQELSSLTQCFGGIIVPVECFKRNYHLEKRTCQITSLIFFTYIKYQQKQIPHKHKTSRGHVMGSWVQVVDPSCVEKKRHDFTTRMCPPNMALISLKSPPCTKKVHSIIFFPHVTGPYYWKKSVVGMEWFVILLSICLFQPD